MNKGILSLIIPRHFFFCGQFFIRSGSEFLARQNGNWIFYSTWKKTNDSPWLHEASTHMKFKEAIPLQTANYVTTSVNAQNDPLIINGLINFISLVINNANYSHPVEIFDLHGNRITIDFFEKWEIAKSIFKKYRTHIFAKIL